MKQIRYMYPKYLALMAAVSFHLVILTKEESQDERYSEQRETASKN